MKKRILAAVLVFAMALTVIAPLTVFADWEKQSDGSWKYSDSGGYYMNGIYEIGDERYCFDGNGVMQTGWLDLGGMWYYADSSGVMAQGWKKVGQTWYYFDPEDLYMYDDGIWTIGGKNYYFNSSGAMQTGWIKETYTYDYGGTHTSWFYAKSSGELASGWEKIGGTWYYFDKTGSWMYSYDVCEIDGQPYFFYPNGALGIGWCSWTETYSDGYSWTYWFYANSSGVLQNGWQKIGGVWYYFDLDDYDMYCDDWYEIDGKAYYFDRSGKMCTGWCSYSESYPDGYSWTEWYYANSSGVLQTGWQWIGGVWYYFNPEYYYMYTGVKKIGEETHAFDSNGAWLENKRGWLEVKNGSDTTWYYILPDGTGATGWQTINGAKYYFAPDYYMYANGTFYVSGQYYAFAKSGALITGTGWQKFTAYGQTRWCYTQEGTVLTGWQTIGGVQYYFYGNGYMAAGNIYLGGKIEQFSSSGAYLGTRKTVGWIKAENYWYYVEDTSGTLAKGWRDINGAKYYFHLGSGRMYHDGSYYIDGKYYTFDSNGHCINP